MSVDGAQRDDNRAPGGLIVPENEENTNAASPNAVANQVAPSDADNESPTAGPE